MCHLYVYTSYLYVNICIKEYLKVHTYSKSLVVVNEGQTMRNFHFLNFWRFLHEHALFLLSGKTNKTPHFQGKKPTTSKTARHRPHSERGYTVVREQTYTCDKRLYKLISQEDREGRISVYFYYNIKYSKTFSGFTVRLGIKIR